MLIVKDSGKTFHLVPEGNHQAVCWGVWDVGNQRSSFNGKEVIKRKVIVAWELQDRIESNDEWNGTRYRIYKRYTMSLNPKSALFKDLTSWRGKQFTEEEKKGFDIESLISMNCFLNVIHTQTDDKTYANITTVSSLPKGVEKIKPENKPEIPDWVLKVRQNAVQNGDVLPEPIVEDSEQIPF